eukprot:3790623-Rhodomonas_salina.1
MISATSTRTRSCLRAYYAMSGTDIRACRVLYGVPPTALLGFGGGVVWCQCRIDPPGKPGAEFGGGRGQGGLEEQL